MKLVFAYENTQNAHPLLELMHTFSGDFFCIIWKPFRSAFLSMLCSIFRSLENVKLSFQCLYQYLCFYPIPNIMYAFFLDTKALNICWNIHKRDVCVCMSNMHFSKHFIWLILRKLNCEVFACFFQNSIKNCDASFVS